MAALRKVVDAAHAGQVRVFAGVFHRRDGGRVSVDECRRGLRRQRKGVDHVFVIIAKIYLITHLAQPTLLWFNYSDAVD